MEERILQRMPELFLGVGRARAAGAVLAHRLRW
jgi:hypothetical protein